MRAELGRATRRARRAREEAVALTRRARQARELAQRYEAAAAGERLVAAALIDLTGSGWRLLVDRRWPGTRHANVDMILVGPGGVFVIDVKNWHDGPVLSQDRLYAGGFDRHTEVDKLLAQARLAQKALGALGLSPVAVHPMMVFAGHRMNSRTGRVLLLGQRDVVAFLAGQPGRLNSVQVRVVAEHLERAFPEYEAPHQYIAAERRGRRTPVRVEDRKAVWALYEEYERLRIAAGIHDYNDVLSLALEAVERGGQTDRRYSAVIVDEVQDLTLVGVKRAAREHERLARRQLFVAVTRARDSLWLGSVSSG